MLRRIRPVLYEFAFGTNISLFKISGSAVHSAVLTVYQTSHSAPLTADNLRSCTPTVTLARTLDAMEARSYEEPTIKFEDNMQTHCFANEIKLAKPLKMLTNLLNRVLKQSGDL